MSTTPSHAIRSSLRGFSLRTFGAVRQIHTLVPSQRRVTWIAAALLLAVATFGISVAAGGWERNNPTLSVLDEGAHYDYVLRLRSGDVPRSGTYLSQDALRVESCAHQSGASASGCAIRHRSPHQGAGAGYSYEYTQPPLGYLPYVLTASPGSSPERQIKDARRGGLVWAAVAASLAVALAAIEDMSLLELAALLIICLLNPSAVYAESTITNDSSAVTAGLLTLLCVRLLKGRKLRVQTLAGFIVGLLIGLLKGNVFCAPMAVLLATAIEASPWQLRRLSPRSLLAGMAAPLFLLIGCVAAFEGWQYFQAARALIPASVVNQAVQGFAFSPRVTASGVIAIIVGGVSQLVSVFASPDNLNWTAYGLVGTGIVSVLVAAALYPIASSVRARAMAIGVWATIAFMAVYFTLTSYVLDPGHPVFSAAARYGLPLVPVAAMVMIELKRRLPLLILGVALPLVGVILQLTVSV